MHIIERATGKLHEIVIEPIVKADYKRITKKRYFFDWKTEQPYQVFKLRRVDNDDIMGLVSFEVNQTEPWILIRLLTVSIENKGTKEKVYERIAGNLIAHVCREAQKLFEENALVALEPKTGLIDHYIATYGFGKAGKLLAIDGLELEELLKEYLL